MTSRFLTTAVLFCLVSIATAATVYQQYAYYVSSTCAGNPEYYTVIVLPTSSSCNAASCAPQSAGNQTVVGVILSCPTSLLGGIPSGNYLYEYEYSGANCNSSATVNAVSVIQADTCFFNPSESGSQKYSCDSGAPQLLQYSDNSCNTLTATEPNPGCTNTNEASSSFSSNIYCSPPGTLAPTGSQTPTVHSAAFVVQSSTMALVAALLVAVCLV